MRTILKNGTVVTPEGALKRDLAMEGRTISQIAPQIPAEAGDEVLDVDGCLVFP